MSIAIAMAASIKARVIAAFDDPSITSSLWQTALAQGDTNEVFLTAEWQRSWWETFGRGRLMLIVAERDCEPIAIAPLFAEAGMVFFVGSGGSDYLDFIGDISDPEVLDAILMTAKASVPDFLGFRFYHLPDQSRTGKLLSHAADRLGLKCYDEGELAAPLLDLSKVQTTSSPADKKSLVRHERALRRDGDLVIEHSSDAQAIDPYLDEFFAQHIDRWKATAYPSLFLDQKQTEFYRRVTASASESHWLRFTRVVWNDRPVAFHFGFNYLGKFLWYKPSFAIDLAKRSPGEVLLRNLLLQAMAESCQTFDFGSGDEAFKSRFATGINYVRTWGLYA